MEPSRPSSVTSHLSDASHIEEGDDELRTLILDDSVELDAEGSLYHTHVLEDITSVKSLWSANPSHLYTFTSSDRTIARSLVGRATEATPELKLQTILINKALRTAEASGASFATKETAQLYITELQTLSESPQFRTLFKDQINPMLYKEQMAAAFLRQGAKRAMLPADFRSAEELQLSTSSLSFAYSTDPKCQDRARDTLIAINNQIIQNEKGGHSLGRSQQALVSKYEISLLKEETRLGELRAKTMTLIEGISSTKSVSATTSLQGRVAKSINDQRGQLAKVSAVKERLATALDVKAFQTLWEQKTAQRAAETTQLHEQFATIQAPFIGQETDHEVERIQPAAPKWGLQAETQTILTPTFRSPTDMINSLETAVREDSIYLFARIMHEMTQYPSINRDLPNLFSEFPEALNQESTAIRSKEILQGIDNHKFRDKDLIIRALTHIRGKLNV